MIKITDIVVYIVVVGLTILSDKKLTSLLKKRLTYKREIIGRTYFKQQSITLKSSFIVYSLK